MIKNDIMSQQKALIGDLENLAGKGRSSVVEMQKDYANDDKICLTSVAFLPRDIFEAISGKIINPLREIEPDHYYYSPEQTHLTIKNVRIIHKPPRFDATDINEVNKLFEKIIPQFSVIEFFVEDVVLWPASISVIAYGDENLQKLVSALDKGLKEIGLADDKKYLSDSVYFGSTTICRLTHEPGEKFKTAVKNMKSLKIGKLVVNKINLVTGNAVLYPRSRNIIAEYSLKME